ncbi:helix-turn-helix domain-containing protein [Alistipes sp.]|uniref:helix-turn-helix domain-containing protein n=1 Tax=Alistipes sp. TaxID=1872444 RepID=UPI003AB6B228
METNGPKNRIRAHFLGGGTLTVLRALDLYSTTELRSVVWRLRQDGYDIRNRRIRIKAADGGLRHVKEYYLFQ